jgi:glycerol-3-phosphate dehydrogenase
MTLDDYARRSFERRVYLTLLHDAIWVCIVGIGVTGAITALYLAFRGGL